MNYIARGCMYCEGICNKECLPKKETVEEAAENFWRNDETMSDYAQQAYITGFIQGAKWQMDIQSDFLIGFLEFIE